MRTIMIMTSQTPSLLWFRLDMMKSFVDCGYSVLAVGNESEDVWGNIFQQYGIEYKSAPLSRNGTNPFSDLKTLKYYKRIVRENKPDKLFLYNAKSVIYGSIAGKKYNIDTYSLIAGLGSVFLSKSIKNKILSIFLAKQYKRALKHNKKIFFQNNDDISFFVKNMNLEKCKCVLVHGSGVNLQTFSQQTLPDFFSFLCIGRLIRDKGIIEYLEACKIVKKVFPDVKCYLAGPFDTNPTSLKFKDIEPYIKSGVIEYFGESNDVASLYKMCSVYVLPSYREGTPKTVLEAMATGRAIITSDAPGCKETVIDGQNGYLVPIKNVEELANKMIECCKNIGKVKDMGEKSRKLAEEIFDVRKINNKIIEEMEIVKRVCMKE